MFLSESRADTPSGLEDTLVIQATGGAFEKALDEDFYQAFTKETEVRDHRLGSA